MVSSLCHGRHYGEHRSQALEDLGVLLSPRQELLQQEKQDPVPWRMKDLYRIPNYHLMADSVTLQIKCLK